MISCHINSNMYGSKMTAISPSLHRMRSFTALRASNVLSSAQVPTEDLAQSLHGRLILAPLTRGNNLPFRRLCAEDFDCDVTMSEMIFARNLIKGEPRECALIRRSEVEKVYGVQIATKTIDEGSKAGILAAEAGAQFLDLNCGCPIYEATRRGLGSNLLKKPNKLARLVHGIASEIPIPMTVKVRIGIDTLNIEKIVDALQDTGIAAISIHGRTAQQRYKRSANWDIIDEMSQRSKIPIIGNGDVLALHEIRNRMDNFRCAGVMIGRGALTKPWVFKEFAENREILPTAEERVQIYRKLVQYQKKHFGDDEYGKRKAWYFLPWHLGFFCRYRPLPKSHYESLSSIQPLISTRWDTVACQEIGETVEELPWLERLLRCESTEAHESMAHILWDSHSDEEAIEKLTCDAEAHVVQWEELAKQGDEPDEKAVEG
jgi:tRNA-dihydrouridine synthase 3